MQDIGYALNDIMQTQKCSPIYAFLMLSKKAGEQHGICKLQSESEKKISRRLCNKSNLQSDE